jgi:threonine/homoserine/homoserine lactone efflux protein
MAQLLGLFFLVSLSGALAPGPLSTMAIIEGSRRGKWAGWWLSVGHGLVEGAYVAGIALLLWIGREALLEQPVVVALIALVGGGFLVWMGWGMVTGAWQGKLTLANESVREPRMGLVPTGIVFSISNPYWWIWWALLAALYIRQSLAWGVGGVALLFLVHWLSDVGWLTGLAWLTGSGRGIFSPSVYRWVLIGCGLILLVFGIYFLNTGVQVWLSGEANLLSEI